MKVARRALIAIALLCVVVAIGAAAAALRGWRALNPGGGGSPMDRPVATTAAGLDRGEHLAAIACASCHSDARTTALAGGESNAIDPQLGQVVAPNLTPGGVMKDYTLAQLAHAVRHGVSRDGRRLLGMPAAGAAWSDEDLAALYDHLRRGPVVERAVPARRVSLRAALLVGAGLLDVRLLRDTSAVSGPRSGMTREHGRALVRMLACAACHGDRLRGGRHGALVPQPGGDLAAFAARQSLQAFDDAMRRGVGPDGTVRDRSRMPYASYRSLTDAEVGALYTYLQSLNDAR